MCIVCNTDPVSNYSTVGDEFLSLYSHSQYSMKVTTEKMLECSKVAKGQHAKRYDSMHKKMVKILREWNNIEHLREGVIGHGNRHGL